MNDDESILIGKKIFDKYVLIKKLGEGSFGSIYEGHYQNKKYALKIEDKSKGQRLLQNEAFLMNTLKGRKTIF